MKLSDYMNKAKFPLTSQPGLSAKEQLMIDAFNLDQLKEALEMKVPLNEKQKAHLRELKEKAPHMGALSAEAARQK